MPNVTVVLSRENAHTDDLRYRKVVLMAVFLLINPFKFTHD